MALGRRRWNIVVMTNNTNKITIKLLSSFSKCHVEIKKKRDSKVCAYVEEGNEIILNNILNDLKKLSYVQRIDKKAVNLSKTCVANIF